MAIDNRPGRNAEGYPDPTAAKALSNIRREECRQEAATLERIGNLVHIIKATAELAGFEVAERIILKDKASGKIYK